jgi:hypothetical protein
MIMTNRPTVNPTKLSQGWKPAFLLHIGEEATPTEWQMYANSPKMWRWYFCLWENEQAVLTEAPEQHSGITSAKFSGKKSRVPASKAHTWATQMLGRQLAVGEGVNWDELYPVPCRVKIEREPDKDFIKIGNVEAWLEGNTS